jgi:hypothetical protein
METMEELKLDILIIQSPDTINGLKLVALVQLQSS